MAIKAIINNTEKEIEQIKNSDEQDIDYVYSRIGDTEVEGELPISIKSIGGNLADYRIYGNTVSGESVGDRTGNLFDENSDSVPGFINDDGSIAQAGFPITTYDYINVMPTENYYLKIGKPAGLITLRNIRIAYYSQDKNYLSRIITGRVEDGVTFETPDNCYYIRLSIDDGNTDIMLNAGSTALPYEPYGYKVPVTVEGKNLLQNTATSKTVNGVTFTVNDDGSVTCNGTANKNTVYLIKKINLYEANYILTGCPEGGTRSTYSMQYTNNVDSAKVDYGEGVFFTPYNSEQYPNIAVIILIASGYTCNNLTFYPMIRKADIEDDTYEPYHAPVTTPIYLPEQIRKVGDEVEYIDYGEQKMHRIGADDINVTLPALSTIKGTNTFSVNTSIQPSNIYIKDNFDYKKVFTATRTIEGELPLKYRSIEDNDSTLKNYRIYGNTVGGESVGDLVESGEHAGEYKVDVTVEGKNLLQNTATSTTRNGVTFTVNSDGSVTFNGTADKAAWFDINRTFDVYSPDGRIASIGNQGSLDTFYMNIGASGIGAVINSYKYSKTTHNNAWIHIVIASGYTCDNITLYPMIRKADIEDDTYEPYHAPVTTPIYLPEPIEMVGDEAEYIDYGEQKMHRIGADDINVTLPALPTLTGTNVLSVGTAVQPSEVEIKGKIKEAN